MSVCVGGWGWGWGWGGILSSPDGESVKEAPPRTRSRFLPSRVRGAALIDDARLFAQKEKTRWIKTPGRTGTETQQAVRIRWARNPGSPGAQNGDSSPQLVRKTRRYVCGKNYSQGDKGYGRRHSQQATPKREARGELAQASYPRKRRTHYATNSGPRRGGYFKLHTSYAQRCH